MAIEATYVRRGVQRRVRRALMTRDRGGNEGKEPNHERVHACSKQCVEDALLRNVCQMNAQRKQGVKQSRWARGTSRASGV